jgi:hypothetical protein
MTDYASFRQRLDAVLRTLDVKRVQDFLIAEGQWSSGSPADPEFAMGMVATQHCPFYTKILNYQLIAASVSLTRHQLLRGYAYQAQARKALDFCLLSISTDKPYRKGI